MTTEKQIAHDMGEACNLISEADPALVLGKSSVMRSLLFKIQRTALANASVLITGESGTGKEVVARTIHELGHRAGHPFIPINCAAIPEALLESELFGHLRGAFTGACQDKIGLFEEATGGTLFLDEIGDLGFSLQAKLLRVLQERQIRPVGSNILKKIDVRIIAATHRDLFSMTKQKKFREDLYYRLNVIPIRVPPLRERSEDIEPLAKSFIARYLKRSGVPRKSLSSEVLDLLKRHSWPGNVRELENVIERALLLSEGDNLQPHLVREFLEEASLFGVVQMQADRPNLRELEERYIRRTLQEFKNKKEQVAKVLGISRRTLYRKERIYGLSSEDEGLEIN